LSRLVHERFPPLFSFDERNLSGLHRPRAGRPWTARRTAGYAANFGSRSCFAFSRRHSSPAGSDARPSPLRAVSSHRRFFGFGATICAAPASSSASAATIRPPDSVLPSSFLSLRRHLARIRFAAVLQHEFHPSSRSELVSPIPGNSDRYFPSSRVRLVISSLFYLYVPPPVGRSQCSSRLWRPCYGRFSPLRSCRQLVATRYPSRGAPFCCRCFCLLFIVTNACSGSRCYRDTTLSQLCSRRDSLPAGRCFPARQRFFGGSARNAFRPSCSLFSFQPSLRAAFFGTRYRSCSCPGATHCQHRNHGLASLYDHSSLSRINNDRLRSFNPTSGGATSDVCARLCCDGSISPNSRLTGNSVSSSRYFSFGRRRVISLSSRGELSPCFTGARACSPHSRFSGRVAPRDSRPLSLPGIRRSF
jgi:hypothetical protein